MKLSACFSVCASVPYMIAPKIAPRNTVLAAHSRVLGWGLGAGPQAEQVTYTRPLVPWGFLAWHLWIHSQGTSSPTVQSLKRPNPQNLEQKPRQHNHGRCSSPDHMHRPRLHILLDQSDNRLKHVYVRTYVQTLHVYNV